MINTLKRKNSEDSIEKFDSNQNDQIIITKIKPRLGKCEVCDYRDALYTCPKCEVKTCCLQCSQIHKKELECNGIRDRTKYIPLKKMTKMDFMNDYRFLEECTRYTDNRKTDKIKRYTRQDKSLPTHLYKLRNAASERKIFLKYLLEHFTKHKVNTTFYDWKTKLIYWRCEWLFPNAGNLKFIDERCNENDTLLKLLDKYLNPNNTTEVFGKKTLEFYQAKGLGNLKILLKSEGIKKCNNRYYELDCKKSLKDNLSGKTLVEFPCFYIFYKDGVQDYDIIDSDEDVEGEAKKIRDSMRESYKKPIEINNEYEEIQDKKIINNLNNSDSRKLQKKHIKQSKKLKSLLFSNDDALSSSDTDDDNQQSVKQLNIENNFGFGNFI